MSPNRPRIRTCDSMLSRMRASGSESYFAMPGGVNRVARCQAWRCIINSSAVTRVPTRRTI